jgi:G patch domain-containing protein 1
MDEEDLADAAEAQRVTTSDAFAGIGASSSRDGADSSGLMGLFKTQGETMGTKLLRRMGWKDGQGIGPKVRRGARLDMSGGNKKPGAAIDDNETHLFAPDDTPMIQFIRKTDRKGLGFEGEAKLQLPNGDKDSDTDDDGDKNERKFSLLPNKKSKPKSQRGGIGIGILNDNGSDDEDPYEIGPKIKYNRTIGGDKKKKKKQAVAASNPALGNTPVFVPKTARAGNSLRRCHDGRLPLDGFVLAKVTEDLAGLMLQYAPPPVPTDWVSAKKKKKKDAEGPSGSAYVSSADAAKASKLDPASRAALLGEKALPGKSVFDYLSASARDKLAIGSGKLNLPQGKGEVPEEYRLSDEEKQQRLWSQVPKLDAETALAAISRSSGGPYADDETKRARYMCYLESQADSRRPPPTKPAGMLDEDFLRELNEFYNCARIFKPMTGFMASRFTTAKTTTTTAAPPPPSSGTGDTELLTRPEPKAADPAEEAAKIGMFGTMTRTVGDFYPTRLLCKRFNVKPPANVKPDNMEAAAPGPAAPSTGGGGGSGSASNPWAGFESRPAGMMTTTTSQQPGVVEMKALPASTFSSSAAGTNVPSPDIAQQAAGANQQAVEDEVERINPERNEAVEGKAAAADALKAIFGDSDSDSE